MPEYVPALDSAHLPASMAYFFKLDVSYLHYSLWNWHVQHARTVVHVVHQCVALIDRAQSAFGRPLIRLLFSLAQIARPALRALEAPAPVAVRIRATKFYVLSHFFF